MSSSISSYQPNRTNRRFRTPVSSFFNNAIIIKDKFHISDLYPRDPRHLLQGWNSNQCIKSLNWHLTILLFLLFQFRIPANLKCYQWSNTFCNNITHWLYLLIFNGYQNHIQKERKDKFSCCTDWNMRWDSLFIFFRLRPKSKAKGLKKSVEIFFSFHDFILQKTFIRVIASWMLRKRFLWRWDSIRCIQQPTVVLKYLMKRKKPLYFLDGEALNGKNSLWLQLASFFLILIWKSKAHVVFVMTIIIRIIIMGWDEGTKT
jgi:hypothetical protein